MLVFFGHHKCASTSTSHILQSICIESGLRHWIGQLTVQKDFILQKENYKNYDFLLSSNSNYQLANKLPFHKAFHLIRDPRDLIISGYYSHLNSHPIKKWHQLGDHRRLLKSLNKEEGLFAEMEFSAGFLKDIASWNYNDIRILEVKFENLISDPENTWLNILKHLGLLDEKSKSFYKENIISFYNRFLFKVNIFDLMRIVKYPFSQETAYKTINRFSFKKLSKGRKKGNEDQYSHYRKGTTNDWKNHLNEVHKKRFTELFGELLIKTRYEKNEDW